jgi:8-oxo-dGTP pyrophosphatase MutT (NUDIX family)
MAIDESKNPWTKLSGELKYENPWIKVEEDQVLNPSGNPGIYGKVHFKNVAVGIIPIDDEGNTWIVGQYRYPLNEYSWEIIEGGSKEGSDPLESAKRELLEESGIIATEWELLAKVHTSNSVTDEVGLIYIARKLSFTEAIPEETEQLQLKKIPIKDLIQMAMEGKITDSLSLIGIFKLSLYLLLPKS